MEQKTLEEQGWQRQSILEEPRLTECADLYRQLGYEVMVVPYEKPVGECGECTRCLDAAPGKYKVVYTRRKGK